MFPEPGDGFRGPPLPVPVPGERVPGVFLGPGLLGLGRGGVGEGAGGRVGGRDGGPGRFVAMIDSDSCRKFLFEVFVTLYVLCQFHRDKSRMASLISTRREFFPIHTGYLMLLCMLIVEHLIYTGAFDLISRLVFFGHVLLPLKNGSNL